MEGNNSRWLDKVKFLLIIGMLILQWNAQSITAHGDELKKFVNKHEPDVICIQETWLNSKKKYNISGYDVIRKDRETSNRGGCCIIVKKGLAVSVIPIKTDPLEAQMVEIRSKNNLGKIFIANIYNPCLNWCSTWLDPIFEKADSTIFVCGDFNGHNTLWGSEKNDSNGKVIYEIIDDHDLSCLNTGQPTRIDTKTGRMSCIDLTLCSSRMAAKCEWEVLENSWGSDHFPILIRNGCSIFHNSRKKEVTWSFKKANWPEFNDACKKNIT